MSAVSAIGLELCPMATKCSTETNVTTKMFPNPTPAYQYSLDERRTEPDFQVNVYLSATIHHNNITINSDKSINIDMKSVNNLTSSSTEHHNVFRKLFPGHFEFLRGIINESADDTDAGMVNGDTEEFPKNEFLKSETDLLLSELEGKDDESIDPCSHPEYIVFTWVRISVTCKLKQMIKVL